MTDPPSPDPGGVPPRAVSQYELIFNTSSPITNAQAQNLLEIADDFTILDINPFGIRRYRFVATSNADMDEFLALVRTLVAPNTYDVLALVRRSAPSHNGDHSLPRAPSSMD